MSEVENEGKFERGKIVSGNKFIPTIIICLVIFTIVGVFGTLFLGEYFGGYFDKRAQARKKTVELELIKKRESEGRL
jgi:hypothetical protein